MNLAIIGASSGIGLNTVNLALNKKHYITTLSRTTQTIPDNPFITKISGDATISGDVKKAISHADAVIISIGKRGRNNDPGTLFSKTAKAFLQAVNEINFTGAVFIVTGFGAGASGKYHNLIMKILFRLFLKNEYDDKTRMEKLLSESGIKWEIVRPGVLNDKPAIGNYKIYTELQKDMKIGTVSRHDVATFLLDQAENPTYLGRYVSLTN
ncbi:Putative NADH-flavin reductase [Mucilaginibacter lappiensis]|uniref:NADH-flavin reductase n=1 Tax=Mucilaginibacter lappiensis TaxID=354630 RepID=A0ABR6PF64_9SPHI|nr:NAD(P)H-binding protein [Mucilaginibacter lappiensis]MBB6107655.1 putative NADH-flavin reductase [Mucilaginibacter lappiensis]SIQ01517.1 Putative NADH-flavin reductase [Mucilaginibacter lappiensis]